MFGIDSGKQENVNFPGKFVKIFFQLAERLEKCFRWSDPRRTWATRARKEEAMQNLVKSRKLSPQARHHHNNNRLPNNFKFFFLGLQSVFLFFLFLSKVFATFTSSYTHFFNIPSLLFSFFHNFIAVQPQKTFNNRKKKMRKLYLYFLL